MNVRRTTAALLAAVMMAGGVTACVPAGNRSGSGSAAAQERTVWPVDYRDVRELLSKAVFDGASVATADGETVDVLRDGRNLLVTEKSDDPAAAADHAAKRAAALMAAIEKAEKGVGKSETTQSVTYAVVNGEGRYLAAVTAAKGSDAMKLARDGKKDDAGNKTDVTLADILNGSTGWALVEDAATAASTATAGGSLVTDFGDTKVEVDTSTPKADAEKARAEQEAQAAAEQAAQAQAQQQKQQSGAPKQQSSGGNGGGNSAPAQQQSAPAQPQGHTHNWKPLYTKQWVQHGEPKQEYLPITDPQGRPTGEYHWVTTYPESTFEDVITSYICTICNAQKAA